MSSPSDMDVEYDSEASDSALLAKEPWVAGWGSTARVALLLGFGCVAAVAFIKYCAQPNGATDDILGEVIQKMATHGCSNGYVPTHLDVTNHVSKLYVSVPSLEVCEGKCDAENGCKAMEYNAHAKHCFTSSSGHSCEADQIPPWLSCVKKGENITSDGKCKQDVGQEIDDAENNETLKDNNETNQTQNATL